jgi:hypothetical protein
MNSPLSGVTYGSRHQTSNTPVSSQDTVHRNIVTVNFYGGTSLQAQELNEIQEQIQRQTTMLNKLLQQWPIETNTEKRKAFKNPTDAIGTVIPTNPEEIIVLPPNPNGEINITINSGVHLIRSLGGYCYFVNGKTFTGSLTDPVINNYKERYVNSNISGWTGLRDNSQGDNTDDITGAGRLQYYNKN